VEHQLTSGAIDALTTIWQRVLQRPSVGLEDPFFDVGGDPSSAIRLFAEIAKEFGRELPPETIYQAPTVAALGALLENSAKPLLPPLALLKTGSEAPPVFITHGLGGSILEFFAAVRHINSSHPIYGIQAKGTDGLQDPLDRIEDMAQFYLDAIREVQPRGPYLLIGYSLGGLVTLEMAQRLSERGEKVALLAMLDAYPFRSYLPFPQRVKLMSRRARYHASSAMKLPARQAVTYFLHPAQRQAHNSLDGREDACQSSATIVGAAARVRDSANLALMRYRPRFYDGTIKFVRAEIESEFPDDPVAVWAKLAREFEVETVPGDHQGILNTHFESLASVLSRYLREAFARI
jgi:thioesterase domain-containing protein/acyl carrier protein